jgi:hypothetical protein
MWLQLDFKEVFSLLSNSNLQLSSEFEAWEALCAWLLYSLPDRKEFLCSLLSSCVRLEDMDILQLQQLRQTQIVSSCPEAASHVSAVYSRLMLNSLCMSQSLGSDGGDGLAKRARHD